MFGLRRYKRLNFGINSAAEIFQDVIRTCISGIQGAINVSDDILIFGRDQVSHNRALEEVFKRLRDNGLTLNKDKCAFDKQKLDFFGHIFSSDGISPDPKKVQDIKNAPQPTNAKEMRSLLGLANYCSRYIPGLASITEPLRDLTKKNTTWQWTPNHTKALDQLKYTLSHNAVNTYYDMNKHTELIVDASPVGLGAVLAQHDKHGNSKVVAYSSRTLTDVESRYSQTEREALAVTWGCLHFHLYLYGRQFTVVTDHKPLVSIFGNPNSNPPLRIERWILKLQQYDYNIIYSPGENNPADFMSRHPTFGTATTGREAKIAEEYVNMVVSNAVPKALTISEIQDETLKDDTLQYVIQAVRGRWTKVESTDSDLVSFYNIRD